MNKYELFLFLLYPSNQSWLILWKKAKRYLLTTASSPAKINR